MSRIVLVESAPAAPGLLSFGAWEALTGADVVLLREPESHPSTPHLDMAGVAVEAIGSGTLDVRDRRDLLGTGDPGDRRLASWLCERAETGTEAVVLMRPDDTGLGRAIGLEAARRHIEVEWIFLAELPAGGELLRLVEVLRRLRDPEDGCPWDLEQDHASLARYLVEETYETLDAIAEGDDAALVEELGDVLLQVVFHAQIGTDRRVFGIDDVARAISEKLERRHPHVFGDASVEDAEEVTARWDELKAAEKPEREGPFDGIPSSQPAVPLTAQLLSRAAKHHVPRRGTDAAVAAVRAALDGVGDDGADAVAIGELLLATVDLAAGAGHDPELLLREAAVRLRDTVETFLRLARVRELDLGAMDEADRAELLAEAAGRVG